MDGLESKIGREKKQVEERTGQRQVLMEKKLRMMEGDACESQSSMAAGGMGMGQGSSRVGSDGRRGLVGCLELRFAVLSRQYWVTG